MRLSMVQNNGELVADDAGIKFEMIFASQEMLCITYCIAYHKPFTIHSVYHSKCLGVGSMDSMDWTFVRKLSTMKWPYILRYQYQSHDLWPWAESTAPQVKRFPSILYIQVLKIPRAPKKKITHIEFHLNISWEKGFWNFGLVVGQLLWTSDSLKPDWPSSSNPLLP